MSRRFHPFVTAVSAAVLAVSLAGCGDGTLNVRGVGWMGEPLPLTTRAGHPGADLLHPLGLSGLAAHAPRQLLQAQGGAWGDSLALLEFADEAAASLLRRSATRAL